MNLFRHYRAFGLTFRSALEMPQWPSGLPPCDVEVAFGDVPDRLAGATGLWHDRFWGTPGRCLMDYPNGRMLVEAGVRVTLASQGSTSALSQILAGTGVAALLYQRGRVCLHASAVALDGRAYLVMGPSGAGKSTSALALLDRGGEFLSDDVTAIERLPDGRFAAVPSFPTLKLWDDSHASAQVAAELATEREPSRGKLRVAWDGIRAERPVPIARIFFLASDPAIDFPIAKPMAGNERVAAVQRSLFRRAMARLIAEPQKLAATTIALAQEVEIFRLIRPTRKFELERLVSVMTG